MRGALNRCDRNRSARILRPIAWRRIHSGLRTSCTAGLNCNAQRRGSPIDHGSDRRDSCGPGVCGRQFTSRHHTNEYRLRHRCCDRGRGMRSRGRRSIRKNARRGIDASLVGYRHGDHLGGAVAAEPARRSRDRRRIPCNLRARPHLQVSAVVPSAIAHPLRPT